MKKRNFFRPKLGQYLTHALDVMELKFFRNDAGGRKYLKHLTQLTLRSVKFTVPELPPYPVDDVLAPQDFRPPYPISVFETHITKLGDDGSTSESALVILAHDKNDCVDLFFLVGDLSDPLVRDWGGTFFAPRFYYSDEKAHYNDRGMPIPELRAIKELSARFIAANASMDFNDREGMMIGLKEQIGGMVRSYAAICYALQNNVTSHIDVKPDAKENRTRRIMGQTPLFTHKTLVIGEPKPKAKTHKGGGTHASPRSHLRRGHYRTGKNGNRYWVSAAFVNGAPGFVHKDYELKVGAQDQ
jgi:hypothetical protein